MAEGALQVVQFIHPGFEYGRREHVGPRTQRSGVMPWKPGRSSHDRKFMVSSGSIVDPSAGDDRENVPIAFWGEWEGPSVFWRVDSPGKPFPKVVHAPFRPIDRPSEPVQNTDPMVFGDAFVYSNCMQAHYRVLRSLNPGSIVLFGRYSRVNGDPAFSLDTCMVVDRMQRISPAPFDDDAYGHDLVDDVIVRPLYTEGARDDLTVYFGRGRGGDGPPFSFFPARLMEGDDPPIFARPELRPTGALEGIVVSGNMQGIKATWNLDADQVGEIWGEVVDQVAQQGCGLGHRAAEPPLLDQGAASATSAGNPVRIPSR
jgi:hypothetical protein